MAGTDTYKGYTIYKSDQGWGILGEVGHSFDNQRFTSRDKARAAINDYIASAQDKAEETIVAKNEAHFEPIPVRKVRDLHGKPKGFSRSARTKRRHAERASRKANRA